MNNTEIENSEMSNINTLTMNSKEVEEVETDTFENIDMGKISEEYAPFRLVGRKGAYTLCIGNSAVWEEPLTYVEDAKKLIKKKPWKLILITTKVYSEYVNEYLKKQEK